MDCDTWLTREKFLNSQPWSRPKGWEPLIHTPLSISGEKVFLNGRENAMKSEISGTERIAKGQLFHNDSLMTEEPQSVRVELRESMEQRDDPAS